MNNLDLITAVAPHASNVILAATLFLALSNFKVPYKVNFAISVVATSLVAYIIGTHIDLLGVELMSALVGVAVAPKLIKMLDDQSNL